MPELPPPQPITEADIATWYIAKKQLDDAKTSETLLRGRVFGHFFPTPKEGTNTYVMSDGYQLKAVYTINRSVDLAVFQSMRVKSEETGKSFLETTGIPDDIVRWTPELNVTRYNELTEDQQRLFDNALTSKPGAPQMKVVAPSKRGKAA